ncbi:Undecaprenyl-phosphate 4-deoxy-4-formamido-L-arabinose transferase [Dyadobacter sp. CECT 9275]|uniref:Undecaprenyl-phosphate 4-deoxy-4-formamido-L-arabinose transferase n=1 Tax=Dyadobacter helix TaxID=2822344 RepID=A0A916JEK8_9BACT|nr:glycosyltransferase [Dyadobacter sp. CECT 9275]CAG4998009.1 Undecaprenyl-phosphate 4-deoxy-4-formamido-L-arabinose transferase [Dyadobacter sp. CECT 9275]
MRKYSIIIPVYNRPDELQDLLECLCRQTFKNFEVVVVEDGSRILADKVVQSFSARLDIRYYFKENGGQGFARNHGFERARGDYFILFDSDALIEDHYLQIVEDKLNSTYLDLYGGPDTDHPSFSPIQKAISYSMTSLFTTGGIRGKKNNMGGTFHPRSFNMGLSRQVWERTGGFLTSRMGEDILFSISAMKLGFKSGLIPEAFIYHKRRTRFSQFFRQLKFFGRARINIARYYPEELKLVHTFPVLFTLGVCSIPFWFFIFKPFFFAGLLFLGLYIFLLFTDALLKTSRLKVAALSVIAAFVQLFGYGTGFLQEGWKRLWEKKSHRETGATIEYPS